MQRVHTPEWCDPVAVARTVMRSGGDAVFLYSGLRTAYSGRYSYLAYDVRRTIRSSHFAPLEAVLHGDRPQMAHAWFGYLGYGLRHDLEQLPEEGPGYITLPDLWMTQFSRIIVWDHRERTMALWSEDEDARIPPPTETVPVTPPPMRDVKSNMTRAAYLDNVRQLLEYIRAGDLYQANLTRKWMGTFAHPPDAFALFARLAVISPAPYSACLKLGNAWILSSSPEQFLHMDGTGHLRTRPIKGTRPRGATEAEDAIQRDDLASSSKDRAENLMIVDLMRNDLSRHAVPGSVKVPTLCQIDSYATVHHMASTIEARRDEQSPPLEVVKGCFPPGSMTGTPKIRAMMRCTELEQAARGVYSGALGWFGGDGSLDLSVVIRTLIIQGKRFEFQTGGAIVADSEPEEEWQESLTKAAALCRALELDESRLASI